MRDRHYWSSLTLSLSEQVWERSHFPPSELNTNERENENINRWALLIFLIKKRTFTCTPFRDPRNKCPISRVLLFHIFRLVLTDNKIIKRCNHRSALSERIIVVYWLIRTGSGTWLTKFAPNEEMISIGDSVDYGGRLIRLEPYTLHSQLLLAAVLWSRTLFCSSVMCVRVCASTLAHSTLVSGFTHTYLYQHLLTTTRGSSPLCILRFVGQCATNCVPVQVRIINAFGLWEVQNLYQSSLILVENYCWQGNYYQVNTWDLCCFFMTLHTPWVS